MSQSVDDLLPLLYQSEQSYGWSVGMRAITHMFLQQLRLPPGALLEIGCGAGAFAREVRLNYPNRHVIGIDIHALAVALADAKSDRAAFAQSSLLQLPFGVDTFAAIIALDSFDQKGIDIHEALGEGWRVLQSGGYLILRVSAFEFLSGSHDTAFNTGHRYTRAELATALHASGFGVVRATYANTLLMLPVLVQRFLERNGLLRFEPTLYTDSSLNQFVETLLRQEAEWLRHWNLPLGISLYVVAQKSEQS